MNQTIKLIHDLAAEANMTVEEWLKSVQDSIGYDVAIRQCVLKEKIDIILDVDWFLTNTNRSNRKTVWLDHRVLEKVKTWDGLRRSKFEIMLARVVGVTVNYGDHDYDIIFCERLLYESTPGDTTLAAVLAVVREGK